MLTIAEHPAVVAAAQSKLPGKCVATFEDPDTFATSQIVTVLAVGAEWTTIHTRRGTEFTIHTRCVDVRNLH